ncbi:glutathione S-transferase [Mycena sp. CBHHK59/15]|nr:glutathione S-transferase [Mycena sp. CBHHK59/15]
MTLKLHGHPQSTSTRRVLLILKEKKIPFELVAIDWATADHKQPAWLEYQPFAQIPYIDDDGFILYESRAIARYLVAAYSAEGPALVPNVSAGVKAQALFEQAVAVEAFNFDPYVGGILTERLMKPFFGQTADEAQVSLLLAKLRTNLEGYERILAKTKYLAGDEVTLADLFHVPYLSMLPAGRLTVLQDEEEAKKWPNVVRWANELLAREAWQGI